MMQSYDLKNRFAIALDAISRFFGLSKNDEKRCFSSLEKGVSLP